MTRVVCCTLVDVSRLLVFVCWLSLCVVCSMLCVMYCSFSRFVA